MGLKRKSTPKLPYRLSVCGKDEIDHFAGEGVTHLLSLEDPETPKVTPAWFKGTHRQIQFHDVESIVEAHFLDAVAPTEAQVAEILGFGEECLAASRLGPVHLLVHCYVGVSRSTAACYALAVQAGADERGARSGERGALEYVLRVRPEALPNLLVVKHADHLLGRRGEMVRALAPLRKSFNPMLEEWVQMARQYGSWREP